MITQIEDPHVDALRGRLTACASTASPLATEAATEILRTGGNSVDAAVAAAWALSVCEPSGSGLGGQTVLLIHLAGGRTRVIDGHSHAPAAASPMTITRAQQRRGHRACTVPSTPATLDYAQRKYGVLPAERVLEPAIRLAEGGYRITPLQHRQTGWVCGHLRSNAAAKRIFLRAGTPPPVGEIFRQPELAALLRKLRAGVDDFYRGSVARLIAKDMALHGGLVTLTDLASFSTPVEREPISIGYRGYRVVSVPPPGGGAHLLLALKLLEHLAPGRFSGSATDWPELIALASYAASLDRDRQPLNPGRYACFSPEFFAEDRLRRIASAILVERPNPAVRGPQNEEPGDTTHLTVSDREGNVVSLTQSIQSLFGAKVANPDLGFLYNNYLYTCPRHAHPCQLGSRCLPRSNASPTLVFQRTSEGQRPWLALGAAGSRRITSALLHVMSGVIDRGLDIGAAVSAPRIHPLVSGKVWIEKEAASSALLERLQTRFPSVVMKRRYDYKMGAVHALQFCSDGSTLGAADPRREGIAASER